MTVFSLPKRRTFAAAFTRGRVKTVVTVAGVALVSLFIGRLAATAPARAITVALVPAAMLAVTAPRLLALLAVATLPFDVDILAGRVPGLHVGPSDFLLAVTLVAVAGLLLYRPEARARLAALRPLAGPFWIYAGVLAVLLAAHPDLTSVINSAQRLELTVLPAVVAAVVLDAAGIRRAMQLFVVSATVLAVLWVVLGHGSTGDTVLGIQKNPAGQFMTDAILVLLAAPRLQALRFCLPLLAAGLLFTQSRGGILALAVGMVVLVLFQFPGRRVVLLGAVSSVVVAAGLALAVLPADAQRRFSDVRATTSYSVDQRVHYREDALQTFSAHRGLGVGVGHYLSGSEEKGTLANDPHNVLLLEAAEGGLPLLLAFALLSLIPLVVVYRRARRAEWGLAALAVQASLLTHAQVDVYWVRSTPVIGWLLLGAALAGSYRLAPERPA